MITYCFVADVAPFRGDRPERWTRRDDMSRIGLGLIVVFALVGLTHAGEGEGTGPAVGDKAPAFSLEGSDGKAHALENHLGERPVVIAWFPKAFTSG
jgi:hypothetical protein